MTSNSILRDMARKIGELPMRRHAAPVHVRDGVSIRSDNAEALVWYDESGAHEEPASTAAKLAAALGDAYVASNVALMMGAGFSGPVVRVGGELMPVHGITVQPDSQFAVILEVKPVNSPVIFEVNPIGGVGDE